MLRRSSHLMAPKPKGPSWAHEASRMAQKYTKNFTNGKQAQDIYKRAAQTTAAMEAKARHRLNYYWQQYHTIRQNIKTGPAGEGAGHQKGDNASSSTSSGGTSDRRSFSEKARDFWQNNKQFITSFLAANFMGVIFAIQFGSQIWSLLVGLWSVYWHNAEVKNKRIVAAEKKEAALRQAEEEREDALDDIYGGNLRDMADHAFGDPSAIKHNAQKVTHTRASSAVNSATDEELLQKRLLRREERRRKKEMEESGLVLHDDSYAKREELRQSGGVGQQLMGNAGRSLEREDPHDKGPSAMDRLARQLLQQEEDEAIDRSLSAATADAEVERQRLHQQLFYQQRSVSKESKKQMTRKERRQARKLKRQAMLQQYFAERDSAQSKISAAESSFPEERSLIPILSQNGSTERFGGVSELLGGTRNRSESQSVFDFTSNVHPRTQHATQDSVHDFTKHSFA